MSPKLSKYPNLVVVPVGSPVDKFINPARYPMSVQQHWRSPSVDRNYAILAVQYGDFEPEAGTYDALIKRRGYKWELVKALQEYVDYRKWNYVGFYDDDLLIDRVSVSKSFDFAEARGFKAFQISLAPGSESQFRCTRNRPYLSYSSTNFIESMAPVFHRSAIDGLMRLLNAYEVRSGWGMDIVMSEYLNLEPKIIHALQMFHPSRPGTGSTYSQKAAFDEMRSVFDVVFPRLMASEGRSVAVDYHKFSPSVRRRFFRPSLNPGAWWRWLINRK
jgi:hypothetical protein